MTEIQLAWKIVYDRSPYEGFDYAQYPDDTQGWGSDHPIFRALIDAVRPATIVEVGTWKGASAIHMARCASEMGLRPNIFCVDTWLGTIESYTWREKQPKLYSDLLIRNGWPHIYYQFLSNVMRAGLSEQIIPLPQTSQIGLRMIKEFNITPDLIYIDASHNYEDVKRDVAIAWECVSDRGVIFGDDYMAWPGVTQAINEFCLDRNLILIGTEGKFAIAREGNIMDLLGRKHLVEPNGSCAGLRVCRLI